MSHTWQVLQPRLYSLIPYVWKHREGRKGKTFLQKLWFHRVEAFELPLCNSELRLPSFTAASLLLRHRESFIEKKKYCGSRVSYISLLAFISMSRTFAFLLLYIWEWHFKFSLTWYQLCDDVPFCPHIRCILYDFVPARLLSFSPIQERKEGLWVWEHSLLKSLLVKQNLFDTLARTEFFTFLCFN